MNFSSKKCRLWLSLYVLNLHKLRRAAGHLMQCISNFSKHYSIFITWKLYLLKKKKGFYLLSIILMKGSNLQKKLISWRNVSFKERLSGQRHLLKIYGFGFHPQTSQLFLFTEGLLQRCFSSIYPAWVYSAQDYNYISFDHINYLVNCFLLFFSLISIL